MNSTEQREIQQIRPGDQMKIRGHRYDVRSRNEKVHPPEGLQHFVVMSAEGADALTKRTISRLRVDRTPFELAVCNGPTHEIDPEEVQYVQPGTETGGE